MADVLERFPLFPLGIVCLPTEVLPLHIFEERYKTMIGECLEEERPFGILWLADAGLREIGCTVEVTEVLEEMEDGRLNILVRGGRPFRLLRRIEDLPYPAGDVELLPDEAPAIDEPAGAAARERYATLLERATDTRPDEDDLSGLNAYEMAATVDFGHKAKQELLELRSEDERLRALADLFDVAMKRIEYAERTSERARTNGHVRR
ncbi:MAG: LON peptidase substrate-binding domain-containing protein [Thermoleophilaceae bacterium]